MSLGASIRPKSNGWSLVESNVHALDSYKSNVSNGAELHFLAETFYYFEDSSIIRWSALFVLAAHAGAASSHGETLGKTLEEKLEETLEEKAKNR